MNSSQKKILFADDSPSMRLFAELALSGEFLVDTVCDAEKALSYIDRNTYDLFLIDIYMPKIDGITLIKKIRNNKKFKFSPIIVISTESDDDLLLKGREAGATGWLVKPFDEQHLLKAIRHILIKQESV